MFNISPDYQHLRIFGCACFPHLPHQSSNKLQPKSSMCVFLGYSDKHKGYKCLNQDNNNIIISRHVTFIEHLFPFMQITSSATTQIPDVPAPLLLPISKAYDTVIPTSKYIKPNTYNNTGLDKPDARSVTTLPAQTTLEQPHSSPVVPTQHPMTTRLKTGSLKPIQRMNLHHELNHENSLDTPTTYSEASKKFEWRQAMEEEFAALQQQGTWNLIPPPKNASILGCKWTFRKKFKADGSVARFKARLVAQGNCQEYGLDYEETFSPVAKFPTIRVFFTVALYHGWNIQQLDVTNAFLHGTLNETVYMKQPRGFEDNVHPNYICSLKKAIYGLKQAPRQWYTTFTNHLIQIGFQHSKADPSLLVYHRKNIRLFLLVYVDDILITGDNDKAISDLIQKLHAQFTMKHLGKASNFLGITIKHEQDKYLLSQQAYAHSLLQQTNLTRCNSLSNPSCMKPPMQLTEDTNAFDETTYWCITGALQYLTITRPDIAHAVNTLSQHMHDPAALHFRLLKRLLRYIKGTVTFGLPILKSTLQLRTFSDADWAGDPNTWKSTSGFCTFLGDMLVSWTMKKQTTVSRSSTESEYRALASATADTIWLKRLLSDFQIPHEEPVTIFCDNTSAIALANNPVFHARTKHIEIDQRFVRDHIQRKTISLLPISTVDQIADIFTKALPTPRFKLLRSKLTIQEDSSLCGEMLEHT
ncbi:Retrovirus-related Pol polyprotein from transposon TNT 1-94 [Dendrobium catenatum]|uniref:Retrovirus-related Pol polyprotein from transposon TNT 1-94 n=1 Tax=Dendrobium catenatum TaxID=906689 RepID=A0A2I0WX02_9ASPA|nr:Retrovirus-related Pol polyprotein from transposon TNT 1-94 [Dendrobium catenatum]